MASDGRRTFLSTQLVVVLAVYLVLAFVYSLRVPLFEAHDEIEHTFYAKRLADTMQWPTPGEAPGFWGQQTGRPPLYHLAVAAVTFWIETPDAASFLWLNPEVKTGQTGWPGNKNGLVHTAAERFPWRSVALQVHLARFVSILFGLVAVIVVHGLALEAGGRRQGIATLAAILFGWNPMFLFRSSTVNSDGMLAALVGLVLLLLLQGRQHLLGPRRLLLLGLAVGAAALADPRGALLFPFTLATLFALARRHRDGGWLGRALLTVILPTALVAGGWYGRNLILFHDLLGLRALQPAEDTLPPTPAIPSALVWAAQWGLFGWANIAMSPPIYRVLDAFAAVAGLGILSAYVLRWRHSWRQREVGPLTFLIGWLTLVLLAMVVVRQAVGDTTTPVLFAAAPAIATLLAIGWGQWTPGTLYRPWLAGPMLCFWLLAIFVPLLILAPAYDRPPLLHESQIPANARRPVVVHGGQIRVLGTDISPRTLHPGDWVQVTLYLQTLEPMAYDAMMFIRLLGRKDASTGGWHIIGQLDTYPGWGTYPTNLWPPGRVIRDTYRVPISAHAVTPVLMRVDVGFYRRGTTQGMAVTNDLGERASSIVGQARLLPNVYIEPGVEQSLPFELDGQAIITGYTLSKRRVSPGERIELTVAWGARRSIAQDWTVFTHLETVGGDILAQHDKPPLDGDWPTSAWEPGMVFTDTYILTIPADAAPGDYRLVVGLYRPTTQQRMRVSGPPGHVMDGAAILDTVLVQP